MQPRPTPPPSVQCRYGVPRSRPTPSAPAEDEAEAVALTPGRATVAGSIYGSHGVARYLTR